MKWNMLHLTELKNPIAEYLAYKLKANVSVINFQNKITIEKNGHLLEIYIFLPSLNKYVLNEIVQYAKQNFPKRKYKRKNKTITKEFIV